MALIPAQVAKDVYGVVDPEMLEPGDKMWCALYWVGWERLQPGSAAGSLPEDCCHTFVRFHFV